MKTLVFLTDSYPLTAGEFFIDDEMKVLSHHFQKIIVLIKEQPKANNLNRYIPENLEITTYKENITLKTKIGGLWNIFRLFFIKEWIWTLQKYELKQWIPVFKIMYMDVLRAQTLQKQIKKLPILNNKNTIYYSYWHDYKALALAFLKSKNSQINSIARAHGGDVFANRQTPPYLPFKNFILKNLNQTFSISDIGEKYFCDYTSRNYGDKITVSRLGKFNNRKPILFKTDNQITICSCSHFNPMKRVHLIVDILSELKIKNIKWVHFGWGFPKDENLVYEKIKNLIPDLNFEFKGQVSNEVVFDFYANNYVDLFINVSDSEGIPVSIMEALSAGIPIIATAVGGTPEAVPPEVGFLIEKDFNTFEVAKIVRSYLQSSESERVKYRENAHNFWQENYDAQRNYTNFTKIILNI
ncbi:MAG: glycosyltransferase [Bacteroidetes bacterium]|nr:glycosyltransferase [Bacteroidota bacterium]